MNMDSSSVFSANEPALGYLYQIRYGLLLILQETDDSSKLFIEKIDDISIDSSISMDVYQTKFHVKSIANLTNASVDLWKTIRVWSEGIKNGSLDTEKCVFNLITTAEASKNTIPYYLKSDTLNNRNVEEILKLLLGVVETSDNKANQSAYNSFSSLSEEQQKSLISRVSITDISIDLNETKKKILDVLKYSTQKVSALYERLEGWFFGQVILQLLNSREEITSGEVRLKVIDIADSLKMDNLPNDFNLPIATQEDQLQPYKRYTFVKQLEVIDANQKTINHAISDYHRAFSQKSKWLREGLINALDEIEYHGKLKDDWDRKFSIISSSLSEDNQKNEGRLFYETNYIRHYPQIFIKERFRESYMVTGCCHDLSNKKEIGWHPDFENKV